MKTKKIFFAFLAAAVIIFSFSTVLAANDIAVYVNGSSVSMDNKPQIIEGTTFVPIRSISETEALGCQVNWINETKTIEIYSSSTNVLMVVGEPYIIKQYVRDDKGKINSDNEKELIECMAPRIINSSAYIPLRAMAEALDLEVEWDAETKTIYITSSTSGVSLGNVTFTVDGDTLTISGNGAMEDYDSAESGNGIVGKKGKNEYYSVLPDLDNVKHIVIETGITHIGDYSFINLDNIVSVTMADSVESIGMCAFDDCESLKNVTLSKGLKIIGSHAFSGCEVLENITLPEGLSSIGEWAFSSCDKIDVTLPQSLTSIGTRAFFACDSLTSAIIPDTVTVIEPGTFSSCDGLKNVSIPSSVTAIGASAFLDCKSLTSIIIPDSVTSLGSAFSNCSGLTSIVIPDGVTSIADRTFSGCTGLISIKIPSTVTEIGDRAFYHCSSLKTVYCAKDSVADKQWVYPFSDVEFVYY